MADMNSDYTIVRLTKERLADVAVLHYAVYGQKRDKDYWAKKYDTTWAGIENTGFIAYRGNTPIAFYAVIPCFIRYYNQLVLSAQSADTMTHPLYKQQGLFVKLSYMTFNLCRREGIRIVFGFPNQNFYRASKKLNWQETETMRCFIIPAGIFAAGRLFNKIGLKKIYHVYRKSYLAKFKLPVDGIGNSLLKEGLQGIDRSEAFIRYKKYHATMVIRVCDWRFWVRPGSAFLVGDIEKGTEPFEKVIRRLKQIAFRSGASQVVFQVSPASAVNRLLSSLYPSMPSFPVLFQVFDASIDITQIKFSFADIDIF
jgi:GNAT superfamily N-acetyltransferase